MLEDLLQNIIEATNQQAEMRFKPLDYEQLQQFFGVILAMTIAGGGERRSLWRTESDGPFSAPALGRYMSRNQFDTLLRNLRLSVY